MRYLARIPAIGIGPLVLSGLTLALAACGHSRLLPDGNARVVRDEPQTAVDVDKGVRVVVNCDDWRNLRDQLPGTVTPIKVRIVNQGDQPLRILYEAFTLNGRRGRLFRALPVVPLDHPGFTEKVGAISPIYASVKFQVAARYHDVYPALDPWPTSLERDDSLYDKTYRRWGSALPRGPIRRQALPEGVLGPGGAVTGYLYFESPIGEEGRVDFNADLASATTGAVVAHLSIPLRVE